jgi:hypothetical protein
MRHLLKKQILDLKVDPSSDAFSVQHQMSVLYWKQLVPLLEKVLNELCPEGKVIQLDKVEIDMGCIKQAHLDSAGLPIDYLANLEKTVRRVLLVKINDKKGGEASVPMSLFKQWLMYMKKGHLPWNGFGFSEEERKRILTVLATDYNSVSSLRRLLMSDDVLLYRIILQHGETFLQQLVKILTAKPQTELILFIDEMMEAGRLIQNQNIPDAERNRKQIRYSIWKHILVVAAGDHQYSQQELIYQTLIHYIKDVAAVEKLLGIRSMEGFAIYPIIKKVKTFLSEKGTDTEEPGPEPFLQKQDYPKNTSTTIKDEETVIKDTELSRQIAKAEKEQADAAAETKNEYENKSNQEEGQGTDYNNQIDKRANDDKLLPDGKHMLQVPDLSPDQPATNDISFEEDFDLPNSGLTTGVATEEEIYVRSAGLVLVHPFLTTLFKKLEWVREGKFTGIDNQQRALYLLHYIASGAFSAEEYELTVAKVLCGYPLSMPVAKDIDMSEGAFGEAEYMLEVLIAQWEILKQTTATGLREGFLQRNGKLFTRNNQWCIQVESGSIDVLLDHLPWNLSIIKLPWMKELLYVEWR